MSVFSNENAHRNDARHLIDENVFKTTRSFCYLRLALWGQMLINNFIVLHMKHFWRRPSWNCNWLEEISYIYIPILVIMALLDFQRSDTWWRHQIETFSALLALCAGNSQVRVNSPHKGQWRGALMFSLICVWINAWVNNPEAGDLRRHRGHYDVTAM